MNSNSREVVEKMTLMLVQSTNIDIEFFFLNEKIEKINLNLIDR